MFKLITGEHMLCLILGRGKACSGALTLLEVCSLQEKARLKLQQAENEKEVRWESLTGANSYWALLATASMHYL